MYLGSSSCTHYLILDITNPPLIWFFCSSSIVSVSWLSSALSCSCSIMWLSLSLPAPVEPCSHLVTNLAMPWSLIQFRISLTIDPLTPSPPSLLNYLYFISPPFHLSSDPSYTSFCSELIPLHTYLFSPTQTTAVLNSPPGIPTGIPL